MHACLVFSYLRIPVTVIHVEALNMLMRNKHGRIEFHHKEAFFFFLEQAIYVFVQRPTG